MNELQTLKLRVTCLESRVVELENYINHILGKSFNTMFTLSRYAEGKNIKLSSEQYEKLNTIAYNYFKEVYTAEPNIIEINGKQVPIFPIDLLEKIFTSFQIFKM